MAEFVGVPPGSVVELRREMIDVTPPPWHPSYDGTMRFAPGPTRYYIDGVEVTRAEASEIINQFRGGTDGDMWRQ